MKNLKLLNICIYVCVCAFVRMSIRFWHFLKFTFIEITGFILGSIYINSNILHYVA